MSREHLAFFFRQAWHAGPSRSTGPCLEASSRLRRVRSSVVDEADSLPDWYSLLSMREGV